jgi:hypothetical protein
VSEAIKIPRRNALKTAVAAASWPSLPVLGQGHAQHGKPAAGPAKKQPPFRPRFFTADELAAVDAIAARIIPTDETPGAREARVVEFIDLMVSETPDVHDVYRRGLRWLDDESRRRHQLPFARSTADQQDTLLQEMAGWADAKTPAPENELAVKLFRSVRSLTIDGFYTSRTGLKDLGYVGNGYVAEYKGCTHPEHQK